MTLFQGRLGLVARLPVLGPLVGWTRIAEGQPAKVLTRLWIKADDSDSQPAVMALTARWKDGAIVPQGVQLWQICVAAMPDTAPPAFERFALADIASNAGEEPAAVRMVTIHLTREQMPGKPGLRFEQPRLDYFRLPSDLAADIPPPQQIGGGGPPPRSQEVRFDAVFPEKSELTLANFAAELFKDLEDRLIKERRPVESGSRRPTPKERAGRIALCEATVRPRVARRAFDGLCFAAGCCRHPGMDFARELADRALDALAQRANGPAGPELALMLGDQIYADATAGVLDIEDRLEKYSTRYSEAFSSPGFRRLARRVPVYMGADDHEIRDNWPKDSIPLGADQDHRALLERAAVWGQRLFLAHQRSHGPDQPAWTPSPAAGTEKSFGFWYAFEAAGLPFFCFDTRFERTEDGSALMKAHQLDCFRKWLEEVKTREESGELARHVPKFILSGSVFAPGDQAFANQPAYARRCDSWIGYSRERSEVLQAILERDIQNVVFLSGDFHCGAVASLEFSPNPAGLRCYSVVAPPFYAPFPFANMQVHEISEAEGFQSRRLDTTVDVTCKARAIKTSGYALICVQAPRAGHPLDWEIRVEYHTDFWHGERRPSAVLSQWTRLAGGVAEPFRALEEPEVESEPRR
jgi:hypothetical protein